MPTCAIVGAGPGNGLALGKRFHDAGDSVALLARNRANLDALHAALPEALCLPCDVTASDELIQSLDDARTRLGAITTLIYNAGAGVFGSIDDIDCSDFETAWQVNARGAFVATKAVLPDMRAAKSGNIVFIGATASKRGGARFAAFTAAKAAQYNLAQSLARHLGPEGIHVSYVVLDGVIDTPRTRSRMANRDHSFFLQPEAIADSVYAVTRQHRSAWTFEFDLRPFAESW